MKTNALIRIFFGLVPIALLLIGCSTVTKPVSGRVAQAPTQSAPVPTPVPGYQYGRFTVKLTDSGQQVLGGEFNPPASLPLAVTSGHRHVIFINYQTKELLYYRQGEDNHFEPVIGYAVVTPDAQSLPQDVVRGRVTRIDLTPTWCPTENIRQARPLLPAGCVPFGHPQNAMGAVKFEIAWSDVRGWEYNRLHGTVGYPRGSFWEEETFGCTRLVNDAILNLVALLGGPGSAHEGIEVVVYRSGIADQKPPAPAEENHSPILLPQQEKTDTLPWYMGM